MGGWSREAQARKLEEVNAYQAQVASERQAAAAAGVARRTLRHGRERQERADLAAEAVAFFESPVGLELRQRMVMAAHVVITLLGGGGIRLVCQFLELSGLAAVVAPSYGVQQQVAMAVETAVVAFGERERARLGAGMPARTISRCEDETFHPEVCLVALEPVSNFIVLESYAEGRSAVQWQEKLATALTGLPVRIVQVTSAQAKGLCHHVTRMLGARQTPDLFHVQQDISRATGAVRSPRPGAPSRPSKPSRRLRRPMSRGRGRPAGRRILPGASTKLSGSGPGHRFTSNRCRATRPRPKRCVRSSVRRTIPMI